jgi:hypothetical protein
VQEIVEVIGYQEGKMIVNPLFRYQPNIGLSSTGNSLQQRTKLDMRGIRL